MNRPSGLVLIAVWEFLTAAGAMVAISLLASFFLAELPFWYTWLEGWEWRMYDSTILPVFPFFVVGVMFGYFLAALLGGIWLLSGREWGRILSIIHAGLSFFVFPVGTIIGVVSLIYLTRPEVRDFFRRHR